MKYNLLGKTGIEVSELCFGVLPLGPLQANISVEDAGELMYCAMEQGINFYDIAQMYKTYPHLAKAIKNYADDLVIASKSTAAGYKDMEKAIGEALKELSLEYIDIFHIHAARLGTDVLDVRAGAWQCLLDYQQKGYIKAVGVSTHNAQVVSMLADINEVDVIFPLINKAGLGILGGGVPDMLAAIEKARLKGKGMYAMKALAGGVLLNDYREAVSFVRNIPGINSVAIGMVHPNELNTNLQFFNDLPYKEEDFSGLKNGKSWGLMDNLCIGCGVCVDTCPNFALSISNGKSKLDKQKCILCGYCAQACSEFAIRFR